MRLYRVKVEIAEYHKWKSILSCWNGNRTWQYHRQIMWLSEPRSNCTLFLLLFQLPLRSRWLDHLQCCSRERTIFFVVLWMASCC